MSTRNRLLRNSVLSLALNLVNKASSVIVFILIARRASVEQAGIFSLATTYIAIFSALTWGLDELMVRQVARDRSTSARYFGSFLMLRLVLATGLYGILVAVVRRGLRYTPTTAVPVIIMGFSIILDSLGNVGQALLNAHERFGFPVGAALLSSLIKLIGALTALISGGGLTGVGWAWCIGSALGALTVLAAASRQAGRLRPIEWLDLRFWAQQVRLALPFLTIGFLITLEYQTDVVILSAVRSEAEVGWYSAATMIAFALLLFSQAYRAAVYPLMTRYHRSAPDKLVHLYSTSFAYLSAAVLPMVAGINLLAPRIVKLVYGPAFEGAVIPLRIIAWSLIFSYLNVPNSRLMLVDDRQGWLSAFLVGSMAINIVLNLALDRTWGVVGAAVARLCSTIVFFLPNCLFARWLVRPRNTFRILARPVLAAAIMAAIVWIVRSAPLWATIFIGAAVYIAALLTLKGLPGEGQQWIVERLRLFHLQLKGSDKSR